MSQGECERRGQVYDIINSSYLFQLNTEWAIDARKAGSKLRFAVSLMSATSVVRLRVMRLHPNSGERTVLSAFLYALMGRIILFRPAQL